MLAPKQGEQRLNGFAICRGGCDVPVLSAYPRSQPGPMGNYFGPSLSIASPGAVHPDGSTSPMRPSDTRSVRIARDSPNGWARMAQNLAHRF
jgi:hypothetical protein